MDGLPEQILPDPLPLAAEAAALGVWDWDLASGTLHWDRRIAELHGIDPDMFDGRMETFLDRVHEEDRLPLVKAIQRAIADGGAFSEEFRVMRPDGTTRWVVGRGRAMTKASGEASRMIGVGFDSTELRSGRDRVARTLEHVSDGLAILDTDWRFVYLNGPAGQVLGRDPKDLLGKVVWDEFPEAVGSEFWDHYHRAVETQKQDTFEAYYGPFNGWFEVRASPTPDGLTIYFRNIDARRAAEAERESLVARLRTALARARHVEIFTNALSDALTLAEVASVTVAMTNRSLGTVFSGPALITDDGRHVRFVSLDPLPDQTIADWTLVPMTRSMPLIDALHNPRGVFHGSRQELAAEYPHMVEAAEVAGTHAFANVALVASGRVLGTMSLAWDQPRHFSDDERAFISTIANQCALAVERGKLFDQQRSTAETLQQAILPEALPAIAGWQLGARYLPASSGMQVGGDFYDAYLMDGQMILTVGDVAGHGLRAAAVMGQVRNALRGFALDSLDPDEVMARTRKLVRIHEPDALMTMLFAVLDPTTGDLAWASAGHPPPLVIPSSGGPYYLTDPPSGPIGAPSPAAHPKGTHLAAIEPGGTVVFYTDGLIERREENIDSGLLRLARVVATTGVYDEDHLDLAIEQLRPVDGWRDDVCVLALRREPVRGLPPS